MENFKAKTRKQVVAASASQSISAEARHRMITEAAYYLAEHRGFAGGNPEDDWLQAERDVDRALRQAPAPAEGKAMRGEARSSVPA